MAKGIPFAELKVGDKGSLSKRFQNTIFMLLLA